MPSPEADESHDAEGPRSPPQLESAHGTLATDFACAMGHSDEQHAGPTQRTLPPASRQPQAQSSIHEEGCESSHIVPLKDDNGPRTIERPASSGEPPGLNFKYTKARAAQLDMTRRRNPMPQANASVGIAPAAHLPRVTTPGDRRKAQDSSTTPSQVIRSSWTVTPRSGTTRFQGTEANSTPKSNNPENNDLNGSLHSPQHVTENSKGRPRDQPYHENFSDTVNRASSNVSIQSSSANGPESSLTRPQLPHHEDEALAQTDEVMGDYDNQQQRLQGPNEPMTSAHHQDEYQDDAHLRAHGQGQHHHASDSRNQQLAGSALDPQSYRDARPENIGRGQQHGRFPQARPSRIINKAASAAKETHGDMRSSNSAGRSCDPIRSSGPAIDVRSNQVLRIWQRLVDKEHKEEIAEEASKRETCEAEILRLRSVASDHVASLKAAQKAKNNASGELQQLHNAHQLLIKKSRGLEECLSRMSHEVKGLQKEKKGAAKLLVKTEKKVELLEAAEKSLTASHHRDKQKASQELSMAKERLAETQQSFESAQQLINTLNVEKSQALRELSVQTDRVAELTKSNQQTLHQYGEIEKAIHGLGPFLKQQLEVATQSVKEVSKKQVTKSFIDEVLRELREVPSGISDQHASVDRLQVTLERLSSSFQDKFEELKRSSKSSIRNEEAFEKHLMSLVREEINSLATSQESLIEAHSKRAALEEHCKALENCEREITERLEAASGAQEATQRSLAEVQAELSCLKFSHQTDSARLQQLETSKAAVDQELRTALTKINEEEQKLHVRSEVEQALRQEVLGLKEHLRDAQDSISRAQEKDANVSGLIETEKENARLYFSKHAKTLIEEANAKHANALRAEQVRFGEASDTLKSQSTQIASLKDQIRQTKSELQSFEESRSAEKAALEKFEQQLREARAENTNFQETAARQLDERVKEANQALSDLQCQQQDLNLKFQQAQQDSDDAHKRLEISDNELVKLREELEETKKLLQESEREAVQQKHDAEEMLLRQEEQWVAEVDGIRGQLETTNFQLQESEASHQLQLAELEELFEARCGRQKDFEPGQDHGTISQPIPQVEEVFEAQASGPTAPTANCGSIRKPRRKLDRSTKRVPKSVHRTTSPQEGTQPGVGGSHAQTHHQPSDESVFGEDFWIEDSWVLQDLGRHEHLTEQGVTLRASEDGTAVEATQSFRDGSSKPKLFSELDKEEEAHQEEHPSSSLSSVLASDGGPQGGLFGLQDEPLVSTPTPRFRNSDGTRKQTEMSVEKPFFEAESPVSQANTSRRIESSYQLRQGFQRSGSVADMSRPETPSHPRPGTATRLSGEESSPLFVERPKSKSSVTYSHHRTSQPIDPTQPNYRLSPASAVERPNNHEWSGKRFKSASNVYRTSPIMTRANARAGSRSQAPETQSQELRFRFPEEPSQASANAGSQSESQMALWTGSQPEAPQQTGRVPSLSRMKTSEGSLSGVSRSSPAPKKARKRKVDEMGGRFDQEMKRS